LHFAFSDRDEHQNMSDQSQAPALTAAPMSKQAPVKLAAHEMPCPCCGNVKPIEAQNCEACGARQIADGMAKPVTTLPKLGPAMAALGLVILLVIGFTAYWLLRSDMKVARALLVTAFGESYKFSRDLLVGDNHLLRYNIFTWDAYRDASTLSLVIAPLAFWAMHLARRAWLKARNLPQQFGGLRMAQVTFALAAVLFVSFAAAGLTSIPTRLERGRQRQVALTNVALYENAAAFREYLRKHRSYPQDLTELNVQHLPVSDYWGTEIKYEPFGTVADNRSGAASFSSYTLRSAGPDGVLGTTDDIVMVDGVIVDRPAETDLPPSLLAPEKPRK
jgi:hypothetical protein